MFRKLLLSLCLATSLRADMQKVEHVVVLMLENRSFDNVLAWLYSQENPPAHFIPETTTTPYEGLSDTTLAQYANELPGYYSQAPIKGVPSVADWGYLNSPQYNPYESFPYVMKQIFSENAGNRPDMKGFLQNYASIWWQGQWESEREKITAVMETYTEHELPIFYGLGRHYAVSDSWFCSVPSDTNPNRAFAHCGTSEGQIADGPNSQSMFYSDTLWNRLQELKPETTWKIFWQSSFDPGYISGAYTSPNTFDAMKKIPELESHYDSFAGFCELARNGDLPAFSFIEPQFTSAREIIAGLPIEELSGFRLMYGFEGNDMHPPGDVRPAENLVANIYTSLIANKEAWDKTLLVITFDEHGGLFDHVPPPPAVAPDAHFENGFMFNLYGVRVPTLFISPLIKKSTVIRAPDTPFDHTSLISTILSWQNIDKTVWNLGARAQIAPSFAPVITEEVARDDAVIAPIDYVAPSDNVVHLGDSFSLRDKDGNYLVDNCFFFFNGAFAGSVEDKATLTFTGGSGALTHGSFVFITSLDPNLGENNVLEASLFESDCFYTNKAFNSGQWWTVKSVDNPYLGAPIQYGDKIYLENHTYWNLFQFIPARLTKSDGLFFKKLLSCRSIADEKSDEYYWTVEN